MDDTMIRTWESETPLLHEVMRRAGERYVPWQAAIEVTYRCNLGCRHCYIDEALRRGEGAELTTDELRGILDQLAAAGTLHLQITGGEPLMRPDLGQILEAVAERGFYLALLTNGTLVTSEWIARLRDLRPQFVGTSLYGAKASTHDMVTRVHGSFERTIATIRSLVDAGLSVGVQATLMADNVAEVAEMQSLVEGMGAVFSLGMSLAPTKRGRLGPQTMEATIEDAVKHLRDVSAVSAEPRQEGPTVCQAGRGMCAVSPEGGLYPCLLMPLYLGSLRERSFDDIWRQHPPESLVHLRGLTADDFVDCKGCPYARFCTRCSGAALGETGSLTGRPPSACRAAEMRARLYYARKGGSAA